MAININATLFQQIQDYLQSQVTRGDRVAQELLKEIEQVAGEKGLHGGPTHDKGLPDSFDPKEFVAKLFEAWKTVANEEVGENFWSYPVRIDDIAEVMELLPEHLAQHLGSVRLDNLQLIQNRGHNYEIGNQHAASLTFHPDASRLGKPAARSQTEARVRPAKESNAADVRFKVGDRVRVNERRPQYANHTGIVDQVISVSCRVKLDNGWSAFLPNHCLEKLSP